MEGDDGDQFCGDAACINAACMRFLLARRLARAARGLTLGAACFSSLILVLVPVASAKANELPAAMRFEQGMKAFARGAFEEAASSWSGAARAYEREGNTSARITARALSRVSSYSAAGFESATIPAPACT